MYGLRPEKTASRMPHRTSTYIFANVFDFG
jgi:hypothetical protein